MGEEHKKRCPECSAEFDAGDSFCPNCGHVFASETSLNEQNKALVENDVFRNSLDDIQTKSRNRRRAILLGIAITVGVAVVVGIIALIISGLGQKVHDDSLFPDKALQQYIGEKVDTNGDGKLSDQEINAVKKLDGFEGRGIKSLEGIELFKNLEKLDASNAGIEKLFRTYSEYLFHSYKDKELMQLTVLNLNGNNLNYFSLSDSCPNLKKLYCANGKLSDFDIENHDMLTNLDCSHNKLEGTLDLSGMGSMKTLNCSHNRLKHLELAPTVTNLNCANNKLKGIHFDTGYSQASVTLDSLKCQNNKLVSVVSGSGIAWDHVYLSNGSDCDLSGNPGIRIAEDGEGNLYVEFDQLNP